MGPRRFAITVAVWLALVALAATDLGAGLGLVVGFAFAMMGGAALVAFDAAVKALGLADRGWALGPEPILAGLGLLVAAGILHALLAGLRLWRRGDRDGARSWWARAVTQAGLAAACIVSLAPLARTWPT